MATLNHRIAIKTCKNFDYRHYPRLIQCCNEVLKNYRVMSLDIVIGKDTKANRWACRYAGVAQKRVMTVDTPQQLIEDSDCLILFGRDALLDKLEAMAISQNVKVYKFKLY